MGVLWAHMGAMGCTGLSHGNLDTCNMYMGSKCTQSATHTPARSDSTSRQVSNWAEQLQCSMQLVGLNKTNQTSQYKYFPNQGYMYLYNPHEL